MLLRSSTEGYSDVAEGNIFSFASYPMQYSFYYMAKPRVSLICRFAFGLRFIYSDLCSTLVLLPSEIGLLSTVTRCPYPFVRPSDDASKHVLNKTGVFDLLTFYYTAYRCFMSTSPNSYLIFYHI